MDLKMATRNWMSGLLSLLLVGAAIHGAYGGEPGKNPCSLPSVSIQAFGLNPTYQLISLDEQAVEATPLRASKAPTYKGRTCEQWVEEFRTELDPEERIVSLKALVVFGTNGHAAVVVPLI